MTSQSVHIIANPISGGRKAERLLPALEEGFRGLGLPAAVRRTRAPGHATELAFEAARGGVSRILVIGGDGTIHEVANGLLEADENARPGMAVLPVGTGNDFHRMVRGPAGVAGALRVVHEGIARPFDVGFVRWGGQSRHFVNLLGVGIDTEVLRRRERFGWLGGMPQYLAALGTALVRFRPVPLVVEGEGTDIRAEVLLAAVTVGPSVGGGFFLAPDASPDDGLLDLFVAERLGAIKVMRYIPRALRGTLGGERELHVAQTRGLRFRSPNGQAFAFELDGELMATDATELEIGVRVACLPVLELPEENGA